MEKRSSTRILRGNRSSPLRVPLPPLQNISPAAAANAAAANDSRNKMEDPVIFHGPSSLIQFQSPVESIQDGLVVSRSELTRKMPSMYEQAIMEEARSRPRQSPKPSRHFVASFKPPDMRISKISARDESLLAENSRHLFSRLDKPRRRRQLSTSGLRFRANNNPSL